MFITGAQSCHFLKHSLLLQRPVPWLLDEKAHGTARRVERLSMGERLSAVVAVAAAAARQGGDRKDGQTSGGGSSGQQS